MTFSPTDVAVVVIVKADVWQMSDELLWAE